MLKCALLLRVVDATSTSTSTSTTTTTTTTTSASTSTSSTSAYVLFRYWQLLNEDPVSAPVAAHVTKCGVVPEAYCQK